jgi:hypothetical protein
MQFSPSAAAAFTAPTVRLDSFSLRDLLRIRNDTIRIVEDRIASVTVQLTEHVQQRLLLEEVSYHGDLLYLTYYLPDARGHERHLLATLPFTAISDDAFADLSMLRLYLQ